MKKEENNKCILLNEAEMRCANGCYRESIPEELGRIREIYGSLAEYIICW